MSVESLCQICEKERAEQHCEHCGAMVCERHFDAEHSMCMDCVQSVDPTGVDPTSGEGETYQF
ncbi:hypothetical protein [Haloarchaeobius sp. TZWWS8]|uniref:hypothetical protein n=1 Tax=Haloarchaeobius sp. TZWWS8 TaxID=3446121 RepID=UPI003EBB05D6